jgi:hypothetical protein
MPFVFLHLSDIHFGQEKGGRVVTHKDVRERLIDDVDLMRQKLPNGNHRDFPLKFVRIDDHSFEAIAGTNRCLKFHPIGWRWLAATGLDVPVLDGSARPGNPDIDDCSVVEGRR